MSLKTLASDRQRLFWFLQIAGWLGYFGAAYLNALSYEKEASYLNLVVVVALLGFVLTLAMRYLYRAIWNSPPATLAVLTFSICYGMALIWRIITNNLYWEWVSAEWREHTWMGQISGVMSSFYVLACWSGLYFGIKLYQQYQSQAQQTLAANAAAHQAQLKMLRYQLNPHFLFNTLNAISTLILDRDSEAANTTVTRLSDFLRYTLDNDPKNRVTLRKELEAIDLYLEIETVRFGERLIVKQEVEVRALDALVPSLILQPLVENAIKYAITPREEGGQILISANCSTSTLSITVSDDGPGMTNGGTQNARSTGVGLRNIRDRLQQLYTDQQDFTLAPNHPSGLVATLNLPFEVDE